ncbi:hypothetical protein ACA910_011734 [Epithemia clementina (nom. ined.)]
MEDQTNNEELLAQLAEFQQILKKLDGTYWHCIKDVWTSTEEPFQGGLAKFQELRGEHEDKDGNKVTKPILENYLALLYICRAGEGTEAILKNDFLDEDGESGYSIETRDSESIKAPEEPAGKANHMSKHLKTLSGVHVRRYNKSKAHLIPEDVNCNKFWYPVLQLALGPHVEVSDSPDHIMRLAKKLHTNKLVFDIDHNHYYDDLKYGIILAIPIFESVAAMREWEYGKPYEMLIVCDESETYRVLGLSGTSTQPHIKNATKPDVRHVTSLLSDATKMLAESMVTNWDALYKGFEETTQKKKMESMLEELLKENKVKVPVEKEVSEPKLYKVSFGDLYNGEEAKKYIPDPLLLLVKATVNLSAVHYSKTKKLLQACLSVSSEESKVSVEGSGDRFNTVEPPQGTNGLDTLPNEIRIVSDHEEDDSSSKVTYCG